MLGILPWSYLQSLSLSQVHRQAHQKQYIPCPELETIHMHDKNRHSEVFAIEILDNLGGIHLREAPTIDNVYRRCLKEKLPCKS